MSKATGKLQISDRVSFIFFSLCFFLMAVSSWFAIGQWLRLSIISLLIFDGFALYFLLLKWPRLVVPMSIALTIFVFYFFIILSSFYNIESFNVKSFNHIYAMTFIVFGMFFVPFVFFSNAVSDEGRGSHSIGKAFIASSLVFPIVLFADFFLVNLFDIRLAEFFTFAQVGNADYFTWGKIVQSVAGPAEEPANSAYYSLLFYFCALSYCKVYNFQRLPLLLSGVQVFSLVATMSSTAILLFLLHHLTVLVDFRRSLLVKVVLFLSLLLIPVFWEQIYNFFNLFGFFYKVTLSDTSGSVGTRMHSWQLFFESVVDCFWLGNSPGYNNILVGTGVHSTFFTVVLNYGVFALLALVCFFAVVFFRLRRLGLHIFFILSIIPHAIADYYFSPLFWLYLSYVVSLSYIDLRCFSANEKRPPKAVNYNANI